MRCKIMKGLTNQEVLKRIQEGQVNTLPKPLVKSYKQIICEHVFNLFNIKKTSITKHHTPHIK